MYMFSFKSTSKLGRFDTVPSFVLKNKQIKKWYIRCLLVILTVGYGLLNIILYFNDVCAPMRKQGLTSNFYKMKLHPILDNIFFLFQVIISICCFTIPFFCNIGVGNLKKTKPRWHTKKLALPMGT